MSSAGTLAQRVGMDVRQITGRVKFYGPGHGYGFLTAPEYGDVLLSRAAVDGGERPLVMPAGSTVTCRAIRSRDGWRAIEILDIDTATAWPLRESRTIDTVEPESEWEPAIVKWWNRARGYGFLAAEAAGQDVFVHADTVQRHGMTGLRVGQVVEVRWGQSPRGLMAAELR